MKGTLNYERRLNSEKQASGRKSPHASPSVYRERPVQVLSASLECKDIALSTYKIKGAPVSPAKLVDRLYSGASGNAIV